MTWKICSVIVSAVALLMTTLWAIEMFRYKYVDSKGVQFRTDSWNKETDMLTPNGWVTVQVERKFDEDIAKPIPTGQPTWDLATNKICVEILNPSNQVLASVSGNVQIAPESVDYKKDAAFAIFEMSTGIGLIQPNQQAQVCSSVQLHHPQDNKWTFDLMFGHGWRH
jgi:hypothetical protein